MQVLTGRGQGLGLSCDCLDCCDSVTCSLGVVGSSVALAPGGGELALAGEGRGGRWDSRFIHAFTPMNIQTVTL